MGRLLLAAIGAALLVASASAVAQSAGGDSGLPPGEGRDRVVAICTSCHGAWTFAQLRQGRPGWRRSIGEMVMHGAQVTAQDIDPMVNYLATVFGPGVPLPPSSSVPVTLPEGTGKDLVSATCAVCHGLDRVSAARRSEREWGRTVTRMMSYGFPLSDRQLETITTYLNRHFGTQ